MGCREATVASLLCLGLFGCIVPLGTEVAPAPDVTSTPPMTSCPLFPALPATGRVTDITLPSGATAWTWDDGARGSIGIGSGENPCTDAPTGVLPAIPATASSDEHVTLLDTVTTGKVTWQFYEAWRLEAGQPFGIRTLGRGVARWDPDTGQFSGPRTLLWLSDQPGFGQAAILDDGWLYTWGCVTAVGGWERACMLGRVDPLRADQHNAWMYATGSHQFAADVLQAQPVIYGVGDISVRRHPQSGRLLVTYVKPLDHVVQVRAALAPDGPFSAPHVLGVCPELAGAFCVGGQQHPAYDPDPAHIAITWAQATFDPGLTLDRRTQWSVVPLPAELP